MRFHSLYRYSYGKSPKDLRPAIVACKATLVFAFIAIALFAFAIISFYLRSISDAPKVKHVTAATTETRSPDVTTSTPSADTFARQREKGTQESGSQKINWSASQFVADNFAIVICLLASALLCLAIVITTIYAYLRYRRYLRTRLVSYQLVNRSFDQLAREQLAKVYVRDPIVSRDKSGATILVPKNTSMPEWLQKSTQSNPSKFSILSKWLRSFGAANHSDRDEHNDMNANSNLRNSKRPMKKDMTI